MPCLRIRPALNIGVVVEDPGTVDVAAGFTVPTPATVEDGVALDGVALDGEELDGVGLEALGAAVDVTTPGIAGPADVDDADDGDDVDEPGAVEDGDDELLDAPAVVDEVCAETAPLLNIAAQPIATTQNASLVRDNRAIRLFDICT
jgi:hypothetical protein